MLGNFADVQQAVGSGEQLDEGAELRKPHDSAEIGFADFGTRSDLSHHLQGLVASRTAGRENVHRAIFHHINLDTSLLDDRLDLLAARANKVTNLVGWDV